MKKTIIFSFALLISITLIAQGHSKNNPGHQKKEHHDKDDDHDKDKTKVKNFLKNNDHDNDEKHHENKNHGKGHAYGHHKDGMTGREFGQHRAQEARSKHKPKNKKEADEMIIVIKQENISLIGLIKDKFRQAREKLEVLFKGGKITKDDYISKELTLSSLEGRKNRIELKISF